jgi:putative inorganic carbon (HCO3(-)) transporter
LPLRLEPGRWPAAALLGFAAILMGLFAGLDPVLAVGGSVGVAFLLLTLASLPVGLTVFTTVSFLGLTSVSSGVGLAKLAGFALLLSWLAKSASASETREYQLWTEFPGISWLLAAFLAWACLSFVWAGDGSAVTSSVSRYLLGIALVPIAFTALRDVKTVRAVMCAFVVGAIFSAGYGVLAGSALSTEVGEPERLAGTVGDPNLLASVLVVAMIFSAALALTARRGSLGRLLGWTGSAVCIVGLILTFSRGGLLTLAMALVIAPFFSRRKGAAFAGVALLALTVVFYFAALAPQDARDRLSAQNGGSGRTDIWKVGWRLVEANPVVGVGAGNFPAASVEYILEPGAMTHKGTLIDEPAVAHNMYLQVLGELGVIGLAMFASILIGSIGAGIVATRRFREGGDSQLAILSAAAVVSLAALLGSYYFLSEEYSKQLWLLLAFGPAMLGIARARGRRPGGGLATRQT